MRPIRFSQLSKPRQILLRLCQRINYGSVLNLPVIAGEIRIDVPPEFTVDVKLDDDVGRRCELDLTDFALALETYHLLAQIDSLHNGIVEKIVVHEGIPRRAVLRGAFQEVRL
jgi:hypothetical protein